MRFRRSGLGSLLLVYVACLSIGSQSRSLLVSPCSGDAPIGWCPNVGRHTCPAFCSFLECSKALAAVFDPWRSWCGSHRLGRWAPATRERGMLALASVSANTHCIYKSLIFLHEIRPIGLHPHMLPLLRSCNPFVEPPSAVGHAACLVLVTSGQTIKRYSGRCASPTAVSKASYRRPVLPLRSCRRFASCADFSEVIRRHVVVGPTSHFGARGVRRRSNKNTQWL